ncbi:MAG TPA: polysaccharide deacetylase family protein [Kineosporiaceae bacterium]
MVLVGMVLVGLPGPVSSAAAAAVHSSGPIPASSAASHDLPEGPWPPSSVLAADPATVPPPEGTVPSAPSAAVTPCPAASGVHSGAPGTGKTVALTFDDGPGASTPEIMSILTQAGVPATFFNIGVNESARPALVRREASRGFVLGNHTWSHPQMTGLSQSAQGTELDRASAEQAALVGRSPCLFRPPYGSYNSATLAAAAARQLAVWTWSVDTEDWKATSASSAWVNRIVSLGTAAGNLQHPVVLMHNAPGGNPATVSALPAIISYYHSHGFTFVDLSGGTAAPNPYGDFATDGWSDVLALQQGTGKVLLYPRTGVPFSAPAQASSGWADGWTATRLGDLTGDGRDDVLALDPSTGDLLLYPGSGTSLGARSQVGNGWNGMREITAVGDLGRDGNPDLVAVESSTGYLYRYPWSGSSFGSRIKIGQGWNAMDELTGAGDFDRDGYVDLLARQVSTNDLYLYRGLPSGFGPRLPVGNGWGDLRSLSGAGDYNRDGYTDLIAIEKSTGILKLFTGHADHFTAVTPIGNGWSGIVTLF